MYDICGIGHITKDKIITPASVRHLPGGTAYYFSHALKSFDLRYVLLTAIGLKEQYMLEKLREEGIEVIGLPSKGTTYFENIYKENQDQREQNVLEKASPFKVTDLPPLHSQLFHLGPLLYEDISIEIIKELSTRGTISLDIQGLLRYTEGKKVLYRDWEDKHEAFPLISFVKANEFEMEVITGMDDARDGAKYLSDLGAQEVIITLGSRGSLIYTKNTFHEVPAFLPGRIVDATGCGDTYMAGYLLKKLRGASVGDAGRFGAAMATLKIQSFGPFEGDLGDVEDILKQYRAT